MFSAARSSLFAMLVMSLSCGDSSAFVQDSPEEVAVDQRLASPSLQVSYQYDAEGNLSRLERGGSATGMTYDALALPKVVTDARGAETSLEWTARERLATVTDPRGVRSAFFHDGFDQLRRTVSSDTGETSASFDEAGNRVASRDARGVEATFRYDVLNRRTRARYVLNQDALSFSWGYGEGDGGSGLLTSTTFPGGDSRFEYDVEDQLVAHTQTVGSVTTRVEYGYEAGRQVSVRLPSGRLLELSVDAGQPLQMSLVENGTRRVLLDALTVDVEGNVDGWTWQLSNGARRHELRRDTAGRASGYSLGNAFRALEYDSANRIIGYSHADATGPLPALDEHFTYDELDRLVGFTRNQASFAISYDAAGNRLATTGMTWTVATATNRLESSTTDGGVVAAYAFDSSGHLSMAGELTLTTDLAGRSSSVTRAGTTTTFTFDALGLRVRKVSDRVDLTFVYDRDDHLLGEYSQTGTAVREYAWLDDTLIAFFSGSELFFVESDHLRAPRVAFDERGVERWRWRSRPFGEDVPESAPTGLSPVTLPLRFPGQYADDESGLFFNHFRDYDPSTGRYVQSDPLGLAGGSNGYVYVENNPISLVDPDGLVPTDKWFGHTDPGFQRWWHESPDGKRSGWFSSADEGFDPKKPLDIPNKRAADAVRERYEEQRRAGTLDMDDECKSRNRRLNRLLRRGQRGGGRGAE